MKASGRRRRDQSRDRAHGFSLSTDCPRLAAAHGPARSGARGPLGPPRWQRRCTCISRSAHARCIRGATNSGVGVAPFPPVTARRVGEAACPRSAPGCRPRRQPGNVDPGWSTGRFRPGECAGSRYVRPRAPGPCAARILNMTAMAAHGRQALHGKSDVRERPRRSSRRWRGAPRRASSPVCCATTARPRAAATGNASAWTSRSGDPRRRAGWCLRSSPAVSAFSSRPAQGGPSLALWAAGLIGDEPASRGTPRVGPAGFVFHPGAPHA